MNTETQTARQEGAVDRLQSLALASESLREALITRRPDAIWASLAEQEDSAQWFIAKEKDADIWQAARNNAESGKEVDQLLARIRTTQRINRVLATAFLKVVDKTLMFLAENTNGQPNPYGRANSTNASASPLLVQQEG